MQPSLMHGPGLFVYDSIISFNLEWRAVWSRKISGATALYLALRHVTLLNLIADIIALTVTSCQVSLHPVPNHASSRGFQG